MKIQISKLWFIILETVLTIVLLIFTYGHVFLGKDCTAIINTILGVIFAIYTLYCSKSTIDGVSKAKNGDCNMKVNMGNIINDIKNNDLGDLANVISNSINMNEDNQKNDNQQPDPNK